MADELAELRSQLRECEESLAKDPANADLLETRDDLIEMISMAEELAEEEKEVDASARQPPPPPLPSASSASSSSSSSSAARPPPPPPPGKAAASSSGALHGFKVGDAVQARWSVDGQMYPATVVGPAPATSAPGRIIVNFDEYDEEDEVAAIDVTKVAAGAKKKRKAAAEEDPFAPLPIPASLKVLPTDSAEVKEKKRRRIKNIKSRNRLRKSEKEKYERKSAWQTFAKKKKVLDKGSIFASPATVDGRVGVVGSDKRTLAAAALAKKMQQPRI